MLKNYKVIFFILISLMIYNCNSNNLEETPMENFIGSWKLEGRGMFDGIEIKIDTNFKGKITKLNANKYVNMFAEVGDTWVSGIKRSSNFEFKLTEKKIGSPIFKLYGQKTRTKFSVQFIHKDTIGLVSGNSNPLGSRIRYVRIKKQ